MRSKYTLQGTSGPISHLPFFSTVQFLHLKLNDFLLLRLGIQLYSNVYAYAMKQVVVYVLNIERLKLLFHGCVIT